MKQIKKVFWILFTIVFGAYYSPSSIHAATPPAHLAQLDIVFSRALSSVLILVGAGFLVYLVMSGYQYMAAGSDKGALSKAQSSLTMAFLGLIVSAGAWIILNIVGNFFGIANFGNFTICINTTGCS